jgi:hypothetical protein
MKTKTKTKRQFDNEIQTFLRERGHPRAVRQRSRRGQHVAHRAQHWEGSEIQSLLFDKQWTPSEAKDWATSHGYKATKVHVTDNYIRLRQFPPIKGAEKRTITFGQGIKAIVEQVKGRT